MFDRILPEPSPRRSTTAAAVSSQVVSIPSTNVLSSLNDGSCAFKKSGVSLFGSIFEFDLESDCMTILVTRPLPDGNTTAEALRGRGFAVLLAPMLRFEPAAFHDDREA